MTQWIRSMVLLLPVLILATLGFGEANAQGENSGAEMSPYRSQQIAGGTEVDPFDPQFSFDASAASGAAGNAGSEFDGTYYYTTRWQSNLIHKYDMTGTLVEEFSIPGVTGLRDLAFDGTYMYGGAAANTIYQMDFDAQTLIGTIASPVAVRHIAYDPVADAFWTGTWDTPLTLVSRAGATLNSIPNTLIAKYGSAYDGWTAGGPYLWVFDQGAGADAPQLVHQFEIATGLATGFTYDVGADFVSTGDIAGGLFAAEGIVPGTASLGGLLQGTPNWFFVYELTETSGGSLAEYGVCYGSIGHNDPTYAGYLITVDPATGVGTPIGLTGIVGDFGDAVPEIAINSLGEIYAPNASSSSDLYLIDASTGAATMVSSPGLFYPDAWCFDNNDVLYAGDTNQDLYTVDPATGATTLVGSLGAFIASMAFDPTTNTMYGGGGSTDDNIYVIDLTTGAATSIGTTGLGGATPAMHFDQAGNLYGSKGGGMAVNNLISIDKTTGAGTVVGSIGMQAVAGLSSRLTYGAVDPTINVDPTSIDETLAPDDSIDVTVTISNMGGSDLDWDAAITSSVARGRTQSGRQVILSAEPILVSRTPSVSVATRVEQPTPPTEGGVSLILDDGSKDNSIGLTAGGQFIWLNRFTPSPADFPLTLEEVSAVFDIADGINIGEFVDVYIYEDTDGDGNPGTGAVHLGSILNADVQANDAVTFSVWPTSVELNGPGDVIIALVNRTAGVAAGTFPASIDQTTSQSRSWVGTYAAGNPPNPPPLPATSLWGEIGTFGFPGNWMVRGAGTQGGGGTPDWISLVGTTSGTITPGNSATFDVRLRGIPSPTAGDTTYMGTIEVTSNDPLMPSVIIDVSLTVSATGVDFMDDFEAYTAGVQLVAQNNTDWDTWTSMPGSTEDPFVSNEQSMSGSNSVLIVTPNDLVRRHGEKTSGAWGVSWYMYIPAGKAGYFNTLSGFTPNPNYWVMETYFDVGGTGRLLTGDPEVGFTWLEDTWQLVEVIVDLDQDQAQLVIDSEIIHQWQWTSGTSGGTGPLVLDATDFFGATPSDEMYVDDFSFKADSLRSPTSVGEPGLEIPAQYGLSQNYPNPFNPVTRITYALPEEASVTLKVFNVLGQEVITLENSVQQAGLYEVSWNGKNTLGQSVGSGVYFYRLEAKGSSGETFANLKKMLFLK
jgi:sugar lactone lactonase YvrE